jgi:branched-chain amino acid transport system permease protein
MMLSLIRDMQHWWDSRAPVVHRSALVALLVGVIILPLFFSPLSGFIGFAVIALAYVIMALGLNIVVGFAGLLDLGYVAFFAIGAYASGWFMSSFFATANIHVLVGGNAANLPGVHLNFLLVLVLAAVLCALGGMLIGLPTLRLRGDYVAVVTLAFGEIVRVIAINGHSIAPFGPHFPLTNGSQGITPIDQVSLPFLKTFNQLDLRPWYWLILAMALVALFVTVRLRDSRLGRAWVAIREDEVAAVSMGIPLVRTKLAAYATGAAMGGVSGAFLGSYLNTVNADQFAFSFSIFILAMVILGGLGSVKGVVLGAIVISFINNRLIPEILNGLPEKLGLHFQLTDIGFGVFGFLLVVVMVLLPEGLLPERRHRLERVESAGTEESIFEVTQ